MFGAKPVPSDFLFAAVRGFLTFDKFCPSGLALTAQAIFRDVCDRRL